MPSAKNKVQPQNISHEHELDSKGVYQLANGAWAYRFCKSVNGKNVYKRASTDRKGNPLLTQRDAMLAREEAMLEAQGVYAPVVSTLGIVYRPSATIEEVYEDYCANGRGDRSHNTIKRQDTLWRTYLKADFGKKRFNGISLGEIQDYLANKYYVEGYSYRYVESFLKMFYLFFGQAYSRNYIPAELYNQFCVNKETKIRMPKIKRDEDLSIVSFTDEECAVMDEYFKGTHAETAYLLGRYCGLRINECYGLKWENVDLEKGTISIEQQMGTQDGLIKLFPLKTRNARRVLYLNKILLQHLKQMYTLRKEAEVRLAAQRQQNQTIIIDMNGKPLSCLEMVNTLPEGKIQTVNSMKYHSKVLKDKYGINFKYHHLRHTYGTKLAELNTPTHMLCNQMGHASIKVTQQYYIAISQGGINALQKNIDML